MSVIKVEPIPPMETKQWILKKHYAHRMPCIQYAFGLFDGKNLCGIVTYGPGNSPTLAAGVCGEAYSKCVLELNRLCVDCDKKNAASFLVAGSLKQLPSNSVVISFADASFGHVGYIYQATNWIYTGMPANHRREMKLDGKDLNTRNVSNSVDELKEKYGDRLTIGEYTKKHRYVYFVGNKREVRDMRNALLYPVEPYPKGETKRYDASAKVQTQQTLF